MTEDRMTQAFEMLIIARDKAHKAINDTFDELAREEGMYLPPYEPILPEPEPEQDSPRMCSTFIDVQTDEVFPFQPGMRYIKASKLLASLETVLIFDGHPDNSLVFEEGDTFKEGTYLFVYDETCDGSSIPHTDDMACPEVYFLSQIGG